MIEFITLIVKVCSLHWNWINNHIYILIAKFVNDFSILLNYNMCYTIPSVQATKNEKVLSFNTIPEYESGKERLGDALGVLDIIDDY